jgi:asparagine synthase (glutamine-hydrolysing)
MDEVYTRGGTLLPEDAWRETIAGLRSSVRAASPQDTATLEKEWVAAFTRAVLSRAQESTQESERVGVLLSGGVDSTLIAQVLYDNRIPFTCYTVGFHEQGTKEPEDIVEARRVAARMGWRIESRVLTLNELRPVVERSIRILGDAATPVNVGVGAVTLAAGQLAVRDGTRTLFSGLGSEELFAGYERHEAALARGGAAALDDECWRGLAAMWSRDLVRDTRIATELGVRITTPFLDREVMLIALQLPPAMRILGEQKKAALRAMAGRMGVPVEFAQRPKRAAQYGSRFDAALERLARRAGYASKGAYIKGTHIDAINPR